MATVRCIPQIKRFMEFYDDYLSKEEDDNGVLVAIENLFFSALQVLECYSEDSLIVSISSKDEFLSVCIVIGEAFNGPDGAAVPNTVFVASLRKLISLLNVEIEVNRSFFSLSTDISTIPGFRTRELEKGFIEIRLFGEIAANGEVAMKQDVLIQPEIPAQIPGTPLCEIDCDESSSTALQASAAASKRSWIVVLMMYPFKYCMDPNPGVSSLKARAFLERKRLLGDNRGASFCVSNFDSSDSGIDGSRENEMKEEMEKMEQESLLSGPLDLDNKENKEVPTSPLAFKKVAAAKAVAEKEEAATKQAAAAARAKYIAEKALEDVEAARQRQEAVVDAARAAAEQAAREADEEAAKQAAALAEATAAFKALAASKEAEDEAAARASRSNSVKKSRGFFRRGSKAPSRDPSVGREEAPAGGGGKQRGKSLSRRESKDKSSKRPSVVADAPGATAAASGNSSGATKEDGASSSGTLERRKSLFGREKSNLEKEKKSLEKKEKEARKKAEKEAEKEAKKELKREKSFAKEDKKELKRKESFAKEDKKELKREKSFGKEDKKELKREKSFGKEEGKIKKEKSFMREAREAEARDRLEREQQQKSRQETKL